MKVAFLTMLAVLATALAPSLSGAVAQEQMLEFRARLVGEQGSGEAIYQEFRDDGGAVVRQQLTVAVMNAEPAAQLPVSVNAVNIGALFTSDTGDGTATFATPRNTIPRIRDGTMIHVGELSGSFAIVSPPSPRPE